MPCHVRFRVAGQEGEWREALPLWHDARNGEYRGSVLGLKPGTDYQVRLTLGKAEPPTPLTFSTWPNQPPIGKTIYLDAGTRSTPLMITEGGTSEGYVLYAAKPGERVTIDVQKKHPSCIDIRASYVIVRGLNLKGADKNGIWLRAVHDVVIERCDITDWGRYSKRNGYGANLDSAIKSTERSLARITIQRNRMHHPTYDANSWCELGNPKYNSYHPHGAQAVTWGNNQGNHVIRYNEITSDDEHRFNDGIGGFSNFGTVGFPGPDSDVYGNIVEYCWDDGLEIEGGNRNVRVWGNYIDNSFVGIATCATRAGPLYVYRNVFARSPTTHCPDGDTDALKPLRKGQEEAGRNRGYFAKVGEAKTGGSGRQFWLHNTILQPAPPPGRERTLGPLNALHAVGHTRMITEFVSLNNIWQGCYLPDEEGLERICVRTRWDSPEPATDRCGNTLDYDLYNGSLIETYTGAEAHGIQGVPVYAEGHGPHGRATGLYQLRPDSPGFDAGTRLATINDDFNGKAPDIGAHEAGTPRMEFGVNAYVKRETREE